MKPRLYLNTHPLWMLLLFACGIVTFLGVCGVPYIRTTFEYRVVGGERRYLSAKYWTPGGGFTSSPSDLRLGTCPLLVLRPLEPSLSQRLAAFWRAHTGENNDAN